MLSPSDVIDHLREFLPRMTDIFSDSIPTVSSATIGDDNVMTVVTSSAHNLSEGDKITVIAGKVDVPITDVSIDSSGICTMTTSVDHDLTEPLHRNDTYQVTLAGFTDSSWNTTLKFYTVPTRYTFTLYPPEDTEPTLNGDEVLRTERAASFFGTQTVASVTDSTTFTIDLGDDVPDMSGLTVNGLEIVTSFRIYGAESLERAKDLYTKLDDDVYALFVIFTDLVVSNDRRSDTDFVALNTVANTNLLIIAQNFSILAFIPSHNDLSGTNAQDVACDTIYSYLLKCLYCKKFDTDAAVTEYNCTTTGHGRVMYGNKQEKAYYVHEYTWQLPMAIDVDSGFPYHTSVAFRDIDGSLQINDENGDTIGLGQNLDKERS